jgi:hypothetical protein
LIYQQLECVAIENADDLTDQFRRLRTGRDLLLFGRRSGLCRESATIYTRATRPSAKPMKTYKPRFAATSRST